MSSPQRFAGQVVLVTGASRGIGLAIARAFASEGATVGIVSRTNNAARSAADEIAAKGGRAVPLDGDVSREDDVRRIFAQLESAAGPLDVLVNNAGIEGPTAPATQISLSDWQRVLEVDLTGAFLCAREALRGMIARAGDGRRREKPPGRILNIGSLAGKISYPQRTPYASAKWGLIGLTLSLAEEVGRFGIRVNCICPGPVAGEMIEKVIAARSAALGMPVEKVREKYVGFTMLRRMVQPDEIAQMAMFLASDAAASITGQAIDVTGGVAMVDRT